MYYLDYDSGRLYEDVNRTRLVESIAVKYGDTVTLPLLVLDTAGKARDMGTDVLRFGARLNGVQVLLVDGAKYVPTMSGTVVSPAYEMIIPINTTPIKTALANRPCVCLGGEFERETYTGWHVSSQTFAVHVQADVVDLYTLPDVAPGTPWASEEFVRAAIAGVVVGTTPEFIVAETTITAPGTQATVSLAYVASMGQYAFKFGLPKTPGERGATFVPVINVSAARLTLSWSNDGGLSNPPAVSWLALPEGGVVGHVLTRTADGAEWSPAKSSYTLPTAGASVLGGVKVSGGDLSINANGVLSVTKTTAISAGETMMPTSGAVYNAISTHNSSASAHDGLFAGKMDKPTGGALGQYLRKTSSGVGYAWDDVSIVGASTSVANTWAEDQTIATGKYMRFARDENTINVRNQINTLNNTGFSGLGVFGAPNLMIYAGEDERSNFTWVRPGGHIEYSTGHGGGFRRQFSFPRENALAGQILSYDGSSNCGKWINPPAAGVTQAQVDTSISTHNSSASAHDGLFAGKMDKPTGGANGQILSKTATGAAWIDAPSGGSGGITQGHLDTSISTHDAQADAHAARLAMLLSAAKSYVDDQVLMSVPVGTILIHWSNVIPDGYLLCNKGLVSKTTYARLYASRPTNGGWQELGDKFYLPDMGARYPRGTINGNVGTYMEDAIRNISGGIGFYGNSYAGLYSERAWGALEARSAGAEGAVRPVLNSTSGETSSAVTVEMILSANKQVPTAEENRPRTTVVNFIIKY